MLPDFPRIRRRVEDGLRNHIKRVALAQCHVMHQMPEFHLPEGDRVELHRFDGSVQKVPMKRMGSRATVAVDDLRKRGRQAVIDAYTEAGKQLGIAQARFMFRTINRIAEENGQVHNARGRPMSVEVFLEGLDKIHIDFDDNGNPVWPTLVADSKLAEKFESMEWTDADDKQIRAFIERKRAEWRDRESSRKLVG